MDFASSLNHAMVGETWETLAKGGAFGEALYELKYLLGHGKLEKKNNNNAPLLV